MAVRRVMPVLQSDAASEAGKLYRLLGFEEVVDLGLDDAAGLAVRSGGAGQLHGQRSDPPVTPDMSAEIVHPLQDEEWGVRRFFISRPTAG